MKKVDDTIAVSLDVLRHSASIEGKVSKLLEKITRKRLNALLRETDQIISDSYDKSQEELSKSSTEIVKVSAKQAAEALLVSVPSKTVLESIVSDTLIEGAPSKLWWSKMKSDTAFRFASAVRMGVAQGETMQQISSRISDINDLADRNSVSLVHTSVMQILNDARTKVQEMHANDKSETVWLATLDSRICIQCAPRDGLRWKTLSKKPVGHSLQWIHPPVHFSCRCTTYPETALTDTEGGGRASETGVQSGSTTFEEYLNRQPKEFADEVLGKGRSELFRSGKLTLRDLVSGRGAPLSLDELKAKYDQT